MKTLKRPEAGWPWEQPGYRFAIDWPPGFAAQHRTDVDNAFDRSLRAAKNRQRQIENGVTGTILMSNREGHLQRKDMDKARVLLPAAPKRVKGRA